MTKAKASRRSIELSNFLKNVATILKIQVSSKYENLILPEYPFDAQVMEISSLYRTSRKIYMKNEGQFSPRVCSVARSLSAQDLFTSYIEYSPIQSELLWFQKQGFREVADPVQQMKALMDLNGVSLFHEQNHRVVWQSLPPAPAEPFDLRRYLNFAESIVVALDLALADQIGKKLSPAFEKMKTIYRTGGEDSWAKKSKLEYRQYLHAVVTATYFLLELYDPADIAKGLNHIFPKNKKLVKDATQRSQDLSDLFVLNTNQLWQDRYWPFAQARLAELHADSDEGDLYLPENPLELGQNEFSLVDQILAQFGL